MTERKHNIKTVTGRSYLLALLFIFLYAHVYAQPVIVIGGDVYGGGKKGAVGVGLMSDTTYNSASFASGVLDTDTTTKIVINAGAVRTVFGGGQDGRTYGSTSVTVQGTAQIGGTVNGIDWTGSIHGGLFGAGDGDSAYVFGHSNVFIKGGVIAQNVYGGGNKADLMGTTSVNLQGGDIYGTLYGGARLANIYGYSFVDIDGAHAVNDLIVGAVYGGNDIAGNIAPGQWAWTMGTNLQLPSKLATSAPANNVSNAWNAFVYSSLEANGYKIYIGQLFGGGNGDYTYTRNKQTQKMEMSSLWDRTWNKQTKQWSEPASYKFELSDNPEPTVDRVYLELNGGTFGYVYGGGNKATVLHSVDICLNDGTGLDLDNKEFTTGLRIEKTKFESMGISLNDTYVEDSNDNTKAYPTYQFDRVFGGNNKADMDVQPNWHLQKAKINSLYSGGNEGNMTNSEGLLLSLTSNDLIVNNVYGGCRIANVAPTDNNIDYSARIRITAGTINNVYGGNDISGDVFGGTDIEILSSINGEVYGGGNGAYVYTDLTALKNNATYKDFYYGDSISYDDGDTDAQKLAKNVAALNAFRPSTSKTKIRVAGTSAKPVTVNTVYGGGNSTTVTDAIYLQLGEYVTINNVFLGSNGAQMAATSTLEKYADPTISSLDLTDATTFNTYMQGAAVSCMPTYGFDNNYYSTNNQATLANVGSFYCGGNVGSMTSTELFDITFKKPIKLTNKLVGGCNTAFVDAVENLNAKHEGGFTGQANGTNGDKIHLNIEGIIFATTPTQQTELNAGNLGNIFGGCFKSGIVRGNVVINLNENIIPADYFANNELNEFITDQDNLLSTPLSVFGGGFGNKATVIGNTTVSIFDGKNGASGGALKVFGGGFGGTVQGNTTVNLYGENSYAGRIYGGGFQGDVTGNTTVNLDGGETYYSFGGACNANVGGYAQTYMGAGLSGETGYTNVLGNVYGGNDFGGRIDSLNDFTLRLREGVSSKIYGAHVVKASSYVEYQQGIADTIFGGSRGAYTYTQAPTLYIKSAFVNFRPVIKDQNTITKVFGGGQGFRGSSESANTQDSLQDRSYVLIDIPNNVNNFTDMEVFGAGAYSGLGMRFTAADAQAAPDSVTAVVDLVSGQIKNAYGASYNEGVTRRTIVNVPADVVLTIENIFGGGFGSLITSPCDVIESIVNYSSNKAFVTGSIFGGNNNCRRTLYSTINLNSTVHSSKEESWKTANLYGGGWGSDTWSYYTVINMNAGSYTYNLYGGGLKGNVLNKESYTAFRAQYKAEHPNDTIYNILGSDYDTNAGQLILENSLTSNNPLGKKTNTNVYYWPGSTGGYGYGGGKDSHVSGTTYIGVHGGIVEKDLYAAGESGDVRDVYGTKNFIAETNAFVEGGSVRRVYGGGWKGNVGYTPLPLKLTKTLLDDNEGLQDSLHKEIEARTNVVIGISQSEANVRNIQNYGFYKGIPTVEWNAYGAGERGGIIGTANLTMYNGYVGYRYFDDATDNPNTPINEKYQEKLDDETATGGGRNFLIEHGNLFGSGYDDGSYADYTNVKVYGGYIRNSVYGGGEIAAVGRGATKESGQSNSVRELLGIAKAGTTNVEIYGGNILRSVFGGGKGYSATKAEEYAYSADRRYTDGYVFGQTAANIYGGVIGNATTLLEGEGNVFGGGNIGYVYTKIGQKWTTGPVNGNNPDGYYYKVKDNGEWDLDNGEMQFTEDCKVVVSPHIKVLDNQTVTINNHTYKGAYIDSQTGEFHQPQYVPSSDLNKYAVKKFLGNDTTKMDLKSGIIISNAVFAGGNVSQGSDLLYAEAKTVFGNATASIIDLYCMDLITLGQEGIGGLYGDGNLTFVDGYRELNITNYGTDYYGLDQTISLEKYYSLNDRERAYFSLKYVCTEDCTGYHKGITIDQDEFDALDAALKPYFKLAGVCSIYAGRMMNTIQRADYCGVFGSRMVMKGARDRVPTEVDYTNYTINRIGEVGLHKVSLDPTLDIYGEHGNYFGIYNIVNYLGALTSDLKFDDMMEGSDENRTYLNYKSGLKGSNSRNKGKSHNEVALASGVYLELLQEPERNYVGDIKEYGPITGIIQLNLIAAATGEGGGYVYALNEHGEQSFNSSLKHLTIAEANNGAITYKAYDYADVESDDWMQTSGNFVSSGQIIIDECFPTANKFYSTVTPSDASPAHYWFIKGDFYVYNQEISAYTGSAQAYIADVSMPLTILAQGNATLEIEDIKTNLYADASKFPFKSGSETEREESVLCNNITYFSNSPITYWDWYNLSAADKQYFTADSYVCVDSVYTSLAAAEAENSVPAHKKGEVFTTDQFESLAQNWYNKKGVALTKEQAFRHTNSLNHENGYLLAVSMDQPQPWDEYYTKQSDGTKIHKTVYDGLSSSEQALYKLGPTYKLNGENQTFIFGQTDYELGDLVDQGVITKYSELNATARNALQNQAQFKQAYMALTTCDISVNDTIHHVVERSAIPSSWYDAINNTQKSYFTPAYISLETVKLSDKLILSSDLLFSYEELKGYYHDYPQSFVVDDTDPNRPVFAGYPAAYYCTKAGNYGGTEFGSGQSYQATMYTNLNKQERSNFSFNYDALDIMRDQAFSGEMKNRDYDKPNTELYTGKQQIDYDVIYQGANNIQMTGFGDDNFTLTPVNGQQYTREEFERLANEKSHYVKISTNTQFWHNNKDTLYIVAESFGVAGRMFNLGEVISESDYNSLGDKQDNIKTLMLEKTGNTQYRYSYGNNPARTITGDDDVFSIYMCTKGYVTPGSNTSVAKDSIISESVYENDLVDYQKDFDIVASIPREKSALYVSRDCDIYDFTEDRIFTVIFRYNYAESDGNGIYRNVSERHILNIRVHFESGEPIIGELIAPEKMLPGTVIGLTKPSVQKGAFEVLGGGWELYENENNALTHKNGVPFANFATPMYWYQDNWYVAYYAETYLGRTFSNPVPFIIANYHDLDDVMADSTYHLHIDHPAVKANSRIYLDNYSTESDTTKSKLDLLYDLFDLSLQPHGTKHLKDENGDDVLVNGQPVEIDDYEIKYNRNDSLNARHSAMNPYVKGLDNLEFILKSDVEPKAYTSWKQVGKSSQCFEGKLHGNGYTVSGIDKSLFAYLCDSVYNLGVRGAIAGSGISDNGGYAQNCWVINESTGNLSSYDAIINNVTNNGTVVNGYYNDDAAKNANGSYAYASENAAIYKPMSSFINGEVAYNLNGFYLNKRFKDHDTNNSGTNYWYWTVNPTDNTLVIHEGYASDEQLYVEKYYMDGQYVYSGGSIPSEQNERYSDQENKHYPIYPDDYIYFGQKLTYGIANAAHDAQPKAVSKISQRIQQSAAGNRVYRTPAYYGSSNQDMAYFNSNAAFAATYQGIDAYAGLTAIDFSGYNDNSWTNGASQDDYFKPIKDYAGLTGFNVKDITKNLLVYVDRTNDTDSWDLLDDILKEPSYTRTNSTYETVNPIKQDELSDIKGHLVYKTKVNNTDKYYANSPHFLVDKQDFNAPISYEFQDGDFMWYQRTPDIFVQSSSNGWDAISLPFKVDIVTTQTKGEITHFYQNDKVGHEYWLRKYSNVNSDKAVFSSLPAGNSSTNKVVTNTFLWDHYYNNANRKDENQDDYQTYYKTARTYAGYPYQEAGTPYLIGLPGSRYYEFDLSGGFTAQNTTTPAPDPVLRQIITFVSDGSAINVSDEEYLAAAEAVDNDGYAYMPIYQAKPVTNSYLLSADGSTLTKTASATTVPFRAYMTKTASGAPRRNGTRAVAADSILYLSFIDNDDYIQETAASYGLNIYGEHMNIVVESTLEYEATVTITNVAGKMLKQFSIQPGTKVTVPVNNRGVYIVNRKKVAVAK
jgi:hypothetical protein